MNDDVTSGDDDSDSPVTVIARHHVEPGKNPQFREWIAGISAACGQYDGYLGTEVIRAKGADENEHVIIFRFDNYPHLDAWMESDVRKNWLEKSSTFSQRPVEILHYESLEFWFPSATAKRAPSRQKMALVTFCVIWPLVHFVPPLIASVAPGPPLLSQGLSVLVIVLLMTYAVMPSTTRILSRWLFGS